MNETKTLTLSQFLKDRYREAEVEAGSDKYGETWWLDGPLDPAFVLEDIMSKRAIVDLHRMGDVGDPGKIGCTICLEHYSWGPELVEGPCATLRLLAAPYRRHEGFREEWM